MLNFFRWLIDAIRTDLFYRFGVGGTRMPPDMLDAVGKYEDGLKKH